MDTRADYDEYGRLRRAEVRSERTDNTTDGSDLVSSTVDAMGSIVTSAVDLMVRLPLQATAAGIDWVASGIQGQDGSSPAQQSTSSSAVDQRSSERSASSSVNSANSWAISQDLTGPDLKYVNWTVVFTKPEYETILEPMQPELINYSTDVASFAALKIATTLERGRFGKLEKPSAWVDHPYPGESEAAKQRTESRADASLGSSSVKTDSSTSGQAWRISGDDQRYIQFLYRVEWRLPKRPIEVTRIETVTVETQTHQPSEGSAAVK
jgi:hypothetical protein